MGAGRRTLHSGFDAWVLSFLRDTGPTTQDGGGRGYICVENDDGSAELQAGVRAEAGVSPFDLLPWNAYPGTSAERRSRRSLPVRVQRRAGSHPDVVGIVDQALQDVTRGVRIRCHAGTDRVELVRRQRPE